LIQARVGLAQPHHLADGNVAREQPPEPRGQHHVADLHVVLLHDVVDAADVARVRRRALEHPTAPGPRQHHVDRRARIGQKLDVGESADDAHDAADDAAWRQHRQAGAGFPGARERRSGCRLGVIAAGLGQGRAAARAEIDADAQHAELPRRLDADHLRGEGVGVDLAAQLEQALEAIGARRELRQAGDLRAQRRVFRRQSLTVALDADEKDVMRKYAGEVLAAAYEQFLQRRRQPHHDAVERV
jgi:hypothetical protein